MRTIAIAILAAALTASAADARGRKPQLQTQAFFATAALDEEVDVLKHRSLTLFLGCRADGVIFLGVRTTADFTLITTRPAEMFGPSHRSNRQCSFSESSSRDIF
jgi:hypothetical protein